MIITFPNGVMVGSNGLTISDLFVPNFSDLSISNANYVSSGVLYTAATAAELSKFMFQINAAFQQNATALDLIDDARVVTSYEPTTGPAAGGTVVVVLGTGFQRSGVIKFDGIPAAGYQWISAHYVRVIAPPHAADTVPLTYTDAVGTVTGPDAYIYT